MKIHPIKQLRLLIEGRPKQDDFFQDLYDFLNLSNPQSFQWRYDDPEVNVTDWSDELDYMCSDGPIKIKVQNAIVTKDTWIVGWIDQDKMGYDYEECESEAEADALLVMKKEQEEQE